MCVHTHTHTHTHTHGLPRWISDKESACQCRRLKRCGFNPCAEKIPWSRKWQPAPVFLPGKIHRQRSLVGYIQSISLQKVRHDLVTYIYIYIYIYIYTYIYIHIHIHTDLKPHPSQVSKIKNTILWGNPPTPTTILATHFCSLWPIGHLLWPVYDHVAHFSSQCDLAYLLAGTDIFLFFFFFCCSATHLMITFSKESMMAPDSAS